MRSLLLQVYIGSAPSRITNLAQRARSTGAENRDSFGVELSRTGAGFLKLAALQYRGATLYATEQSENESEEVVRAALKYLMYCVDTAWLLSDARHSGSGEPRTPAATKLDIARGEVPGQYYIQANPHLESGGVCFLRIVDEKNVDVVGRSFMFISSNEVLDVPFRRSDSCLYDCLLMITTVEKQFKDNHEYTLQLWFRPGSGSGRLLASKRAKLEQFER
jgi:hypothetical protein